MQTTAGSRADEAPARQATGRALLRLGAGRCAIAPRLLLPFAACPGLSWELVESPEDPP